MPIIEITTVIDAPIDRVFDLARSIDLHMSSTAKTGERAVAGVTSGLIGAGEHVTWRARHFGIWQSLTVRVEAFEPPVHFSDRQVRGAFKQIRRDRLTSACRRRRPVIWAKVQLGSQGTP